MLVLGGKTMIRMMMMTQMRRNQGTNDVVKVPLGTHVRAS